MRVLWLSHFLPYPPKGGMLQRAHSLFKKVSEQHEVTLIAFNQKAVLSSTEQIRDAEDSLKRYSARIEVVDIPCDSNAWGRYCVAAKAFLKAEAFTMAWLQSRDYKQLVEKVFEQESPDVVHLDTISLLPYAQAVSGIPLVLNHHNIESMMMARRAEHEPNPFLAHYFRLEARRVEAWEKKAAEFIDLNIVCSELDGERLTSIAPRATVETVPNGVDVQYFEPQMSGGTEVQDSLIFVGGMSWYPNRSAVEYLVREIWPLVAASRPSATLTIVGKNPPPWLLDTARMDSRVTAPGFVDDVRPYIDQAAVYVCPIFDGGGTKLKVLDAMAMGKPLVAHPIALEGIDAVEGTHWIAAREPAEFAQAVLALLQDKDRRAAIGRSARQFVVERYSADTIGARYATLLGELSS